jgi:hypothetical protein
MKTFEIMGCAMLSLLSFACVDKNEDAKEEPILQHRATQTNDDTFSHSPPTSWLIEIDCSFSLNQRNDIQDALLAWSLSTLGSFSYVSVNDYLECYTGQADTNWTTIQQAKPNTIVIANGFGQQSPNAGWTLYDTENHALIMLYLSEFVDDNVYTKVVEHELGHAFHLTHFKDENGSSIMIPDIVLNPYQPHITNEDTAYYCSVQRCGEQWMEQTFIERNDYL